MTNSPQIGPKLQTLIDAGCIDEQEAMKLTQQQYTAIEALSNAQIGTLVDVHGAVGPVMNARLI